MSDRISKCPFILWRLLRIVHAHRGTGWLKSPCQRVRRERSWCLNVRELGAAPQRQSPPSAASAASGWSAWWDVRASPRACSSASGQYGCKPPAISSSSSHTHTHNQSHINATICLFFCTAIISYTVHTWAKMRSPSPTPLPTGNSSPRIISALPSFWFITSWVGHARTNPKPKQYDGLQIP